MYNLLDVRNIEISKSNIEALIEIEQKYYEYIQILQQLDPHKLKHFLETLKRMELENNQIMERGDSFLTKFNIESSKSTSIDTISTIMRTKKDITIQDLNAIHGYIISGTPDDKPENYNLRDREVRVSKYNNGREEIMYVPPLPEQIEEIYTIILNYLNSKDTGLATDSIFIKPIITNALISILQPYGNGNSRLGRLVQYAKVMQMTNELFNQQFETPILYLSKNYLLSGGQYREKIAEIMQSQTNKSWNSWFSYNFDMISEQLYFITPKAEKILKR